MVKNLNRIKAVLADKQKTNKWLAEQLDKDPATVSKWCTNSCQPSIETLMQIARLLEVQTDDLLRLEEMQEIEGGENLLIDNSDLFNRNKYEYKYRYRNIRQ